LGQWTSATTTGSACSPPNDTCRRWCRERSSWAAPGPLCTALIATGIRELRRVEPLQTEEVAGLQIPTLAERARIKAWLLATRRTVRDYLDLVVLLERLGEHDARTAMRRLDAIYPQPTGASVLAEVVERLAEAQPSDLASVDLASYRGLVAPWNGWDHVAQRGRAWASVLAALVLEDAP
jgi:hypothetical protein